MPYEFYLFTPFLQPCLPILGVHKIGGTQQLHRKITSWIPETNQRVAKQFVPWGECSHGSTSHQPYALKYLLGRTLTLVLPFSININFVVSKVLQLETKINASSYEACLKKEFKMKAHFSLFVMGKCLVSLLRALTYPNWNCQQPLREHDSSRWLGKNFTNEVIHGTDSSNFCQWISSRKLTNKINFLANRSAKIKGQTNNRGRK